MHIKHLSKFERERNESQNNGFRGGRFYWEKKKNRNQKQSVIHATILPGEFSKMIQSCE